MAVSYFSSLHGSGKSAKAERGQRRWGVEEDVYISPQKLMGTN